jgi:hypothetical protein
LTLFPLAYVQSFSVELKDNQTRNSYLYII